MKLALANRIIEDNTGSDYSKVCGILYKQFAQLGKGAFGTAFEITKDKVIKVYRKHDVAYSTFLSVANAAPSKHYPSVYERQAHVKFNAVCMEKLQPYNLVTNYGMDTETLIEKLNVCLKTPDWSAQTLIDFPDSVRAAMANVHTFTDVYMGDIRRSNLARRGNTLVLLDPICNNYATNKKSGKSVYRIKV